MKLYYQLQVRIGALLVYMSRVHVRNKDGHKVHRKNGRFKRCDCIFLKQRLVDKTKRIRQNLQVRRIRATLD